MDGKMKRTPLEWCQEHDVEILDPDGWRSDDAPGFDEPISEDEFWVRWSRSTIRVGRWAAGPAL